MEDSELLQKTMDAVRQDLIHTIERHPAAMQTSGLAMAACLEVALNIGLQCYGLATTRKLFLSALDSAKPAGLPR